MKYLLIVAVFLLVIGSSATEATAENMHFGAAIGQSYFSADYKDALDQVQKIDENSTAWKIFGGFSGSKFWGIEGGYRDFGKITPADLHDFKTRTSGWDVEAIGRFQIAIVDIFGKAGAMFWSTKTTIDSIDSKEDGTDFFWGIGAGVHLGPIGVRLEWESLEGGGQDNLSMVSLGATLGF